MWRVVMIFFLAVFKFIPIVNCQNTANTVMNTKYTEISTEYTGDRIYKSISHIHILAPIETTTRVADDLVRDFTTQPNNLFNWAFKGLGLQGDGKDLIELIVNSYTYNTGTGVYKGNFDIIAPGFRNFRNINIDAIITSKTNSDKSSEIELDIKNTNIILKKAYGKMIVNDKGEAGSEMNLEVQIKFSWIVDLFLTEKKYRKIVEWRIMGLLENLRNESLRRIEKT